MRCVDRGYFITESGMGIGSILCTAEAAVVARINRMPATPEPVLEVPDKLMVD